MTRDSAPGETMESVKNDTSLLTPESLVVKVVESPATGELENVASHGPSSIRAPYVNDGVSENATKDTCVYPNSSFCSPPRATSPLLPDESALLTTLAIMVSREKMRSAHATSAPPVDAPIENRSILLSLVFLGQINGPVEFGHAGLVRVNFA